MVDGLPLLERDRELRVLHGAVTAALGGHGGFVTVEGAAGLGKTRLLERVPPMAAGFRVLSARGSELERGFGYGVVRQLFEPLAVSLDEDEWNRLCEGPAAQVAGVLGAVKLGHENTADFAALHGLYWLVVNLCRSQPTLMLIDDLHWADDATLRFLAYLLPRLDGLAAAVVAGTRPAEQVRDRLIGRMIADPTAKVVRLSSLSRTASDAVVRAVMGADADDAFCAACHELTGGNPLLLHELARTAQAEGILGTAASAGRLSRIGGRAIGRRVALQLSALKPAAQALARAVAVLDGGAQSRDAAVLAGLEEREALEMLAPLSDAEILRHEVPLGFVHPLVRAAVYDGIEVAERVRLHRSAAQALSASGAAAQRIAAHLLKIPPATDRWVVQVLRDGAAEAMSQAAPASALAYLERALREQPTTSDEQTALRIQAGTVAQLVDWKKAVDHLTQALAETRQPQARARISEMLGVALYATGRGREAAQIYEGAIAELDTQSPDLRRRLEAGAIFVQAEDADLLQNVRCRTNGLRDAPRDDGVGSHMLDAVIAWHDAQAMVMPEQAPRRALRSLADGWLIEDANALQTFGAATLVLANADLDEVVPILDKAQGHAHRRGSTQAAAGVTILRAITRLRRGSLTEAATEARQAMTLMDMAGLDALRPFLAGHFAEIVVDQGRMELMADVTSWAAAAKLPLAASEWSWVQFAEGRLLSHQGQPQAGLELILEAGRGFDRRALLNPAFVDWRSEAALALHSLGRQDEALRMAAEELELARQCGTPRVMSRTLRITGLLSGGPQALAMLDQAVQVVQSSPAQLEHAKALHALGSALRRANHKSQARAHLAMAIDLADKCGAEPLVADARVELRAAGGRPRRTALTGPQALTPSERRVAELAAGGHSNRHIAQALFVTPKTVEVHLTSVYRKLDVENRMGLAKRIGSLTG